MPPFAMMLCVPSVINRAVPPVKYPMLVAGKLRIKQEFFQRLRGFTPISHHGARRHSRAAQRKTGHIRRHA